MEMNTPVATQEEVHSEVCKMFATLANYADAHLNGKKVTLKIEAEYFSGDDIDVSFIVRTGYDDEIVTDNMYRSMQVAIARHKENETLKPKSIPLFRKAVA